MAGSWTDFWAGWVGRRVTEIRELRTFVEVVRSGSITAAAERLNVAQPALSRQLQKLEAELGAVLLHRHGKGVTPTPAGVSLLGRAEDILRAVAALPNQIGGAATDFAGPVVIGVPPTAGLLIAPLVYEILRARWPSAAVQIREGISSQLEHWLGERQLDLAVLHNPSALPGVDIRPVLRERMVLVCPPAPDPLLERPIRFAELASVPLILPGLPHSNRRLLESAATRHGVRLHPRLEVDSVALTKAMVQSGAGYTILTYAGAAPELGRGQLAFRPIHNPPLHSVLALACPQAMEPPWLARELTGILRGVIARLIASGDWPGARLLPHATAPEDVSPSG